ncbi:MAG TPA: radical SAM protein [Bacillota bacterium]|nr:radical SAM protein [Bacillota bacterium]
MINNQLPENHETHPERILLMLLPFWTPMMPPMGIGNLKSFLVKHGYRVKTADANIRPELNEINHKYFHILKSYIPEKNQGNFYNIGFNVLRNHMMAYANSGSGPEYIELVKTIVYQHYFVELNTGQIAALDEVLQLFFQRLEKFLLELIADHTPTMVGISVFTGTLPASLFAFKLIKQKFPRIKTIMGGGVFVDQLIIGSPDYEFFLEKTVAVIDKVIIGEGELLWLKYLRGELPETQRVYSLKDINYEVMDLDSKDIPDHSDLETDYYPYLGATGTVGCPYQCGFCNAPYYWGVFRKGAARNVVQKMTQLYKLYGSQLFFMTDSLLNPIIDELSQAFVEAAVSLYWDGYLRIGEEVCNTENTMLWRRGGFYRARLGVESGSQRMLDLMEKKITLEQTRAAISALAYAGIKTTTYFVIGYPGETEADFQQTLDFVAELKDNIWETECNPFYFFYNGQTNSDRWANRRMPIYPDFARDILISQTWTLNCEPLREETYHRLFRFCEHCRTLGIPNPYSYQDIFAADERWKKLHRNAVPALMEFKNRAQYIDENKKVNPLLVAQNSLQDIGDLNF